MRRVDEKKERRKEEKEERSKEEDKKCKSSGLGLSRAACLFLLCCFTPLLLLL
jgi:hypothetical protein